MQQYPSFGPTSYMPPLSTNPFTQQPSTTQPMMPPVLGHASQYGHSGSSDVSNKGKEAGQGPSQGHGSHY